MSIGINEWIWLMCDFLSWPFPVTLCLVCMWYTGTFKPNDFTSHHETLQCRTSDWTSSLTFRRLQWASSDGSETSSTARESRSPSTWVPSASHSEFERTIWSSNSEWQQTSSGASAGHKGPFPPPSRQLSLFPLQDPVWSHPRLFLKWNTVQVNAFLSFFGALREAKSRFNGI